MLLEEMEWWRYRGVADRQSLLPAHFTVLLQKQGENLSQEDLLRANSVYLCRW